MKEEKGNKNLKNKQDLKEMMKLEDKITSTSHPKKREQNKNIQGQSGAKKCRYH